MDRARFDTLTLTPGGAIVAAAATAYFVGLYVGYFLGLFEGFVNDSEPTGRDAEIERAIRDAVLQVRRGREL